MPESAGGKERQMESLACAWIVMMHGVPVRFSFEKNRAREIALEIAYPKTKPPVHRWTPTGKLFVQDGGGINYKFYWRGYEVVCIKGER